MSQNSQQGYSYKRVVWVDCAKAVAIVAVAVDHCNGLLYHSPLIAHASYFSVTLFILLAGFSVCRAKKEGKSVTFQSQLGKVGKYSIQYALATCMILTITNRGFDLREVVACILNFSASGPYYFFLFFFQLMLIAPFLLSWSFFCHGRKYPSLWHFTTVTVLSLLSYLSIQYTFILPVHGGGQFLFGGTYLLVFYLGILLGNSELFEKYVKIGGGGGMLAITSILWTIQLLLNCYRPQYIDKFMGNYWGGGFNPPSLQLIMFGLTTFYLLYLLFSYLEECKHRFIKSIVKVFAWVGRSTMYVLLYHLLLKDLLVKALLPVLSNIWLLRVCIFLPMIFLPVLVVTCLRQIRRKYQMFLTA